MIVWSRTQLVPTLSEKSQNVHVQELYEQGQFPQKLIQQSRRKCFFVTEPPQSHRLYSISHNQINNNNNSNFLHQYQRISSDQITYNYDNHIPKVQHCYPQKSLLNNPQTVIHIRSRPSSTSTQLPVQLSLFMTNLCFSPKFFHEYC